jgi:hypothetical protein
MPRFRCEPQPCVELSEAATCDTALGRGAAFRVYCLAIASGESLSIDVMARALALSRGAVVSALDNHGKLGWILWRNLHDPPPSEPRYPWLDFPLDVDCGKPLPTECNLAAHDHCMWLKRKILPGSAEHRSGFRVIRNNHVDL